MVNKLLGGLLFKTGFLLGQPGWTEDQCQKNSEVESKEKL